MVFSSYVMDRTSSHDLNSRQLVLYSDHDLKSRPIVWYSDARLWYIPYSSYDLNNIISIQMLAKITDHLMIQLTFNIQILD